MVSNYDVVEVSSKQKYILDFWAEWCGPCKMTSKYIDEFIDEHPEFDIYKVNVDELPEVAEQYSVISLPSILFIENGEIVDRHIGLMTKKQLEEKLL